MDCSYCNTKLQKRDKLCKDCKFDDDVTISKTNVKKLYKLTDQDLNDPDLYYFTFNIKHGYGTRFIIEDIENLIEELSDCSIDDKRYIAMKKIRDQRDKEINDYKLFNEKKEAIIDLLKIMIEKTDQIEYMDQMKYLIENDFYLDIEKNYDINDADICEKLLDVIEKKAKSAFKLNQLIKSHYKKEYDKYMKVLKPDSVLYKQCIDQEIYLGDKEKILNKLFAELERDLITKEKSDRTNEIENLLIKEYQDISDNENFYKYIRMTTGYKRYVEESLSDITIVSNPKKSTKVQSLDDIVKKIGDSVRLKIEKEERKMIIDKKLGNKCSDPLIKTTEAYIKYINNAVDDVETVAKNIISELTKIKIQQAQEALLKKQQQAIVQNRDELNKVVQRLTKNAVNVDTLRNILNDFEKDPDNELLLQDFHGDELIFFNLLCKEKKFSYKRLNYDTVLIAKNLNT